MLYFPFVIWNLISVEMLQCFVTSSDRKKISRNWECDVVSFELLFLILSLNNHVFMSDEVKPLFIKLNLCFK